MLRTAVQDSAAQKLLKKTFVHVTLVSLGSLTNTHLHHIENPRNDKVNAPALNKNKDDTAKRCRVQSVAVVSRCVKIIALPYCFVELIKSEAYNTRIY